MVVLLRSALHGLIHVLQPLLVPTCFVLAWGLMILLFWSIGSALRDALANAKQMHQIPCANCQFFTSSYHLKCPVHPRTALSVEAINCPDYEPTAYRAQDN
ncbi:MAG: hypothetical protein IGS50_14055 [Synechococcales cyanobacterium C42_A2020_086]|jgi:hypothetical protein|nr:hypothetical protein [Synechococcales cyanobacterium M58_A2018_015]MBF2074867.1 hypothetical protein [Synechococcales cyanobacterium C42_A2020_086]